LNSFAHRLLHCQIDCGVDIQRLFQSGHESIVKSQLTQQQLEAQSQFTTRVVELCQKGQPVDLRLCLSNCNNRNQLLSQDKDANDATADDSNKSDNQSTDDDTVSKSDDDVLSDENMSNKQSEQHETTKHDENQSPIRILSQAQA
jgi:hypothetical protein